ncbi:hypothetical protein DBR42_20455 [Pelomonas sp. HMWF004]|nr:hypothetical protein DBR42_20455 [Pelomonas sp. HMWF004]
MKRIRPPGLLVLAVLALHLLLAHEVHRLHDGWASEGPPPMPARMQVALVREMTLTEPVPPSSVAVPDRAPPPPPAPVTTAAASAPSSLDTAPAAELKPPPEPAPEPPPVVLAEPAPPEPAASAPADAAVPAAQTASTAVDGEPGPEWPLSTQLNYVLSGNYRGPVFGQAQVQWLRRGSEYQVHLDLGIGPSFAPLIARRMSSQGTLTAGGIAPRRYDEETTFIMGEPRRSAVVFKGLWVQMAHGAHEPLPAGAQDAASQFVHMTWLFMTGRETLQAGRTIAFPLVLPRRQYAWQYDVVGEELLDTPMGPVNSWHLKPARPPASGDLSAEVWLAPALQYLPVRLLIRQDAETYLDLMLKNAPLQAAPESTDTPRRPSP